MRSYRYLVATSAVVIFLGAPSTLWAQVAPNLGNANSFAVLAGSTVTNTGASTITGDLGVSPGTAVTGFPPGTVVGGTIQAGTLFAANAQTSLTAAYLDLAGRACTQNLTGVDLGGLTRPAGVYCFDTSAQLTGNLILDGGGNPNAVFIFKIGSTLTTASNSLITLSNGAQPCNVFFQVGSSATLGTNTTFVGNILALTSITLTTGARITGRALARNGAVTLDTNTTAATTCAGAPPIVGAPACPVITVSSAPLANGTVGSPFSQTITAAGGPGPFTFSVIPGTLPAGLTLSSAGVLSGTPTVAVPQTFVVTARDANGCPGQRQFTITIVPAGETPPAAGCPVITLSPTTIPNGTVGVAYSQQITAAGGAGTVTFTRTAGSSIPPGLTLSTGGLISGTPTVSLFPDSFTIRATDANGCFVELPYTMAILAGVPTLPQTFVIVMFFGLLLIGYAQLRNRNRTRA